LNEQRFNERNVQKNKLTLATKTLIIFDWFNWLDEYRANVKHYLHLKNEQTLFEKNT